MRTKPLGAGASRVPPTSNERASRPASRWSATGSRLHRGATAPFQRTVARSGPCMWGRGIPSAPNSRGTRASTLHSVPPRAATVAWSGARRTASAPLPAASRSSLPDRLRFMGLRAPPGRVRPRTSTRRSPWGWAGLPASRAEASTVPSGRAGTSTRQGARARCSSVRRRSSFSAPSAAWARNRPEGFMVTSSPFRPSSPAP